MTSTNPPTVTAKPMDEIHRLRLLTSATRAEIVKLATLPSIATVALLTIVCVALTVGALANSFEQHGQAVAQSGATAAVELLRPLILFLQVGPIVLGILAVTQEYSGSQGSTTLRSTPQRGVAMGSKLTTIAAAQVALAALVVGTGWGVAQFLLDPTTHSAGASASHTTADLADLATMVLYLASAGMIASGIALVTRSLASALISSLALLLLAPPLLAGVPTLAQWLPSNVESVGLITWVAITLAIGTASFLRRDG